MTRESTPVDHLLRLLFKESKEHATMLVDPEGRILWWSAGAEHIFGISSGEALGQPLSRLFTPEEVARGLPEHEIAIASSNSAAEDDRWLVRRDGSRFWATGVMVPLRDESGQLLGFGKILRDRTDIRVQLETLHNQVDVLNAETHRKDIFLSTLSHELRNPLAPIANAVHLIRLTEPSPDVDLPLQIIERQMDNLGRLVDDLLDLSRIGAGKLALEKERVSLHDVVNSAVETVTPLVDKRGHRLEVLLPPTPIFVEADAARLAQVFANLINNAVKYTPEGGQIWIKCTTEGNEAVVNVEDNGIGIRRDLLPRIFDLFTQAGSPQGGLGVGLAIVKNLVRLHGGTVQVRSEGEGKGSEFCVRLPLQVGGA
jgi:two-component system CheB/CheR fusion protein